MQKSTQPLPKSLQPNKTYTFSTIEEAKQHVIELLATPDEKVITFSKEIPFSDIKEFQKELHKEYKKKYPSFTCPEEQHKEYAECVVWITHKIGENGQLTTWKIHSNKMLYCPICKRSLRKYILNKDNA